MTWYDKTSDFQMYLKTSFADLFPILTDRLTFFMIVNEDKCKTLNYTSAFHMSFFRITIHVLDNNGQIGTLK